TGVVSKRRSIRRIFNSGSRNSKRNSPGNNSLIVPLLYIHIYPACSMDTDFVGSAGVGLFAGK
ncbi:MAG: hypothetical protein IKD10_05045, partial [Lentisphaeria bacterium]|nr:hypothetical protein [Lentisphaeria bacterium]